MSIIIERTITIRNDQATLDNPIYLYQGDGDIVYLFTIKEMKRAATFGSINTTNLITENASYGEARIYKPDKRLIFTSRAEIIDDKLQVLFSYENIDLLTEVGRHQLQIHLYDDDNEARNRFTIPPIDINVLFPIGSDTSLIDEAVVGYSLLDVVDEEVPTFDEEGNYNKTEWEKGDIITSNKLNKIEDALYEINAADNNFITNEGLETALAGKANAAHNHAANNITGLARVATTGSYNDLSGKPSMTNYATKNELANKSEVGHTHSEYANRNELENKANVGHTHGDYALKTDVPTVPTRLSQLINDKGYITSSEIPANYVTEAELSDYRYATRTYVDSNYATTAYVKDAINRAVIPEGDSSGIDLSIYALKSDIPTATSDLTNDSRFITNDALLSYATTSYVNSTIDDRLGDFDPNIKLDNYYTKDETDGALSNKADANHTHYEFATTDHTHDNYALKEEIPTIPTNVSEFTNDAGYITEDNIDTVMDQISNNLVDNYAAKDHTHDNYANVSHNHNNDYSNINHNHDKDYAGINHTHNNHATKADIQNMVTSNTTLRIEIVAALPEIEEPGVLYIVLMA